MKELHEDQVDRAVLVVEHPLPRQGADVLRHRPRQDQQGPEYPPPLDIPVQQHCYRDAQDHVEEEVHECPYQRLGEIVPEIIAATPTEAPVVEPAEMPAQPIMQKTQINGVVTV